MPNYPPPPPPPPISKQSPEAAEDRRAVYAVAACAYEFVDVETIDQAVSIARDLWDAVTRDLARPTVHVEEKGGEE